MSDWADLLLAPVPSVPVQPGPLPRLSVLIPVYNGADTVGEAIESALVQRPAPFEIVVSDDGSEDDLGDVLASFGDRLRVVRGPNRGLATARNRAAAAARGHLLGLLDADDVWLPGRAAALTEAAAARPDLSIVTTDAVVIRRGRPDPDTYYAHRHFEVADQEEAVLRSSFVFGAGALRASALAAVGGYDATVRWAEDWDLWLRMILGGHRAGLVRAPLYEYRRRDDSLTGRKVDLALGVTMALRKASSRVASPSQLAILAATERKWQIRAADTARAAGDPRWLKLSLAALRARGQASGVRARLAARTVLHALGSVRP